MPMATGDGTEGEMSQATVRGARPALFLRIASVLTFVHALLHTTGGVFGKVSPGPAEVAANAMKANAFVWMGSTHTFWGFYRGMGLAVSISLTAEAIVFWQLASLSKNNSLGLRPIYCTFLIAYLAIALNSFEHFFLAPVIMEILIAGCMAGAFLTTKYPESPVKAR